jgi:biotin synthase
MAFASLEQFNYFWDTKKCIDEYYKTHWTKDEIIAIYNKPMMDLLLAASIHREHHDQTWFKFLYFIHKTGGCPEDCGYCPQAALPY